MASWKDVFLAALTAFCLSSALFMAMPIQSQSDVGEYDPWTDLNGDGTIDIFDVAKVAVAFGTSGIPLGEVMGLEYDSEWIDIISKRGQHFNITHNLNSTDLMVDITGKRSATGGVHQLMLGGSDYIFGEIGKTYGGSANDGAHCVLPSGEGGFILGGWTSSFGAGMYDFWLIKTDAQGNLEWSKTYGGSGNEEVYGMVQTDDGGYAMIGYTTSFGAGGYDFWVVRTDAGGNMLWNKTYGGPNSDIGTRIIGTLDGSFAMVGWTFPPINKADVWLIKANATTGDVEWSKTYGSEIDEVGVQLIQTGDGGYAIAGTYYSFGPSSYDFWVVRTDELGNMLWNKTYGGTGIDEGASILEEDDGSLILGGCTSSYGAGGSDIWLIKTNTTGEVQWSKTYGGLGDEELSWMIRTGDGGYAIAAYTTSFGAGGEDFWVVRTDSDGNAVWNTAYGGPEDDFPINFIQKADGGFMLTGYTESYGAGGRDLWLISVDGDGNTEWNVDRFKYGLAWTDSTADCITLYRGEEDIHWNYVRVRVWKPKAP